MSLKPLDDKEVLAIEACKKGNREAFAYLVDKYKKRAYFLALKIVGNREDALDLSQEAFIKSYRALSRFREGADFKVWFFQILRNCCISHLRKKRNPVPIDDEDCGVEIIDLRAKPEETVGNIELKKALWRAINHLTPSRKETFVLREMEGLSYRQISEVCGITLEQVKSRLHYARKQLMEELEQFL